ncbi:hypothetical protein [Aeromicrobium sp.]|uniref:hypothetical protein n=1 Tax=Aeromicrobium sp. TaxID=1871063 RepID=UPI002FCA4268
MEYTIVRALGVQVYEVEGLEDVALWIDGDILIVRAGLPLDVCWQICDETLALVGLRLAS